MTKTKRKFARVTGIPTTRSGLERKAQRLLFQGLGCLIAPILKGLGYLIVPVVLIAGGLFVIFALIAGLTSLIVLDTNTRTPEKPLLQDEAIDLNPSAQTIGELETTESRSRGEKNQREERRSEHQQKIVEAESKLKSAKHELLLWQDQSKAIDDYIEAKQIIAMYEPVKNRNDNTRRKYNEAAGILASSEVNHEKVQEYRARLKLLQDNVEKAQTALEHLQSTRP